MRGETPLVQRPAAGKEDVLCSEEVVEVELLLPSRQVAALADRASRLGLTSGELLRQLLREFLILCEFLEWTQENHSGRKSPPVEGPPPGAGPAPGKEMDSRSPVAREEPACWF